MHPSHEDQLLRLKKVEGQVRVIQKMIEERRYCMDLLSQIRAVTGALRKIESGILESHLQHCVNDAITSKNKKSAELKIKEITQLFEKFRLLSGCIKLFFDEKLGNKIPNQSRNLQQSYCTDRNPVTFRVIARFG